MPDIGTMHQLNPEPPHIGTMHQLGSEPLHTGEIITPQAQAEEYAREAQESATNAALSAAAAQSAAETAQQAAQSIAPALDEKADAIHTAAGPAPIVSIPDAAAAPVDALTVGIEPVQDLHGYENPWPAGGGKNLLEITATTQTVRGVTFTVNSDGTVNVNGTASAKILFPIGSINLTGNVSYTLNGCPSGGSVHSYAMYDNISGFKDYGSGSTYTPTEDKTEVPIRIEIQSGVTVSNQLFKPMIRLSSVSDATFAPYKNECPISGWDSANVTGTGKNLFDKANDVIGGYVNSSGVFKTSSSGEKTINVFVKAGIYTLSKISTTRTLICYFADAPVNNAKGTVLSTVQTSPRTVTVPADGYFVAFVYNNTGETNTWENVLNSIMLEIGSEASEYTPYSGSTAEYAFPTEAGTVYGAKLTIHQDGSGELMVDRAMVDLGTLNWSYMQNQGVFYSTTEIPAKESEVICSCYIYSKISVGNRPDKSINVCLPYFGENKVSVKDTAYSDAAIFKAAMSGVQLVYELATPIEYTLTDVEVLETLKGVNNIWADTGDLTVGYKADTKLYIDKKFAELQALILEH